MSAITVIDSYKLRLTKLRWSEEELFLAKCYDMTFDNITNTVVVDVRLTKKVALSYFINTNFKQMAYSTVYENFRQKIYPIINQMYNNMYKEFNRVYLSKIELPTGRTLFKHQKKTLAESFHRKNNLWALSMGLGKTLTAATLSTITDAKRTIIICPTLVKWNWFEDMTRFWGYNPMYWTILDAKKSKTIKAFQEKFVVLNFEQVEKNMNYLLSDVVSHIVIDESHAYKNLGSSRSKALIEFIKKSNEPRLTFLTGTPITNRVNDMYSYLKLAKHPLGLKSKVSFEDNYTVKVGARGGRVVGAKNLDDLKGKIANFMIRLRSEDCLDLPPMIVTNYYFESDELTDGYGMELENLKEKKKRYDELHGVEKQKMNHEIKNNIHTLNRLVSTSKVNNIKKLIDSLIEDGEKVVVFCSYKDPINQLEKLYGNKCVKIDGSVPSHTRIELINKFKDSDKCMVFLGNMSAAGIGINLVNASHVIMMNFPFTPDKIEQAQKRLHRPGQSSTVNVYYTIAKETIDEHIFTLMSEKSDDINQVIDEDNDKIVSYGDLPMMLFRKLIES
jgi:SWI/SNF-related matrix-associated actin-dependent regulator of chromatin subfamily A-like protein 1